MAGRNDSKQSLRWAMRLLGLVAALGCAAAVIWAWGARGRMDGGLVALDGLNRVVARTHELGRSLIGSDGAATGQAEELAALRTSLAELDARQTLDQRVHQLVIRADAQVARGQRALEETDRAPTQNMADHVGEATSLLGEAADRQTEILAALMEDVNRSLGLGAVLACLAAALFGFDAALLWLASRSRSVMQNPDSLHQLLAAAVRSTDEGVLISDTGGRSGKPTIVFANQSFRNMSGLTDLELVGKTLGSLRESCLREEEFSLLEHSYSDSRSATMETVRWRDDGSKVHCQWHISPVREESGRVTHYISILSDTTRLREHEEAQRKSHKELMAVNRQLVENQEQLIQSEKMAFLGQLAAGVAHEINNPLGYVMSNLEVLTEDVEELLEADGTPESADSASAPSASEVKQILDESITGLDRVADIVRRLKNFARPADESLEESDLNHEIEEALKIVWNEIKHKCEVSTSFGELPSLRCRPGQLNQVFTNLLLNAAQAIPHHGEISVHTELVGQEIVVRIADTGEGIPREHLSRLFTPFFTTKPAGKGTGLGLSVSYGIVQKHRGTIEVESTPGSGSTFIVRLPTEPLEVT